MGCSPLRRSVLTQLKYHALTASAWWLNRHSRSIHPLGRTHPHGIIWIMTLPCGRTSTCAHVRSQTGGDIAMTDGDAASCSAARASRCNTLGT